MTETANNNTFLGKKEKDFEFAHLLPLKVDFAESTAVQRDPEEPADVDGFKKWILQIAWIVFKTDFSHLSCVCTTVHGNSNFSNPIVDINTCARTVHIYRE